VSGTETGTQHGKKEKPNKKEGAAGLGWDDLTKAGAAVTALGVVLGGLAVAGVLEQVERNHSGWLFRAILLVVIAGALWGIAGAVKSLDEPLKERLSEKWHIWLDVAQVAVGFLIALLFAVGVVLGIHGVILAQQDSQRPSIVATINSQSGLALQGTVKAGGLRATSHLVVVVEGITWGRGAHGRPDPTKPETQYATLYQSWLGPNESGDVEHAINLPLSAVVGQESQDEIGVRAWVVPALSKGCVNKAFTAMETMENCSKYVAPDCYDRPAKGSTGCIRVRIPRSQSGPQLAATWDGSGSTLLLKVQAGGVRADSGVVSIHVFGDAAKKRRLLAVSRLRPDASGKVDSAWRVPIDLRYGPVCAVAAIASDAGDLGKATCPPRHPTLTSWVRLPRPLGDP